MKKQIKRFSMHQTSKVVSFFYFVVTAIICIPLGIYELIIDERLLAAEIFAMPFGYWGVIYVVTMGATWLYNLIASSFGGIEVELEDSSKE